MTDNYKDLGKAMIKLAKVNSRYINYIVILCWAVLGLAVLLMRCMQWT